MAPIQIFIMKFIVVLIRMMNKILFFRLREFLPISFMKHKNVEKKILGEHKTLVGVSEIDAKYKYVRLARSLSTFGVHFFLVKVRLS